MNTILTIYGRTGFKRFLLPALNDADYSLPLSKDLFELSDDLPLKLEVLGNEWRFVRSDDYDLVLADGRNLFTAGNSSQTFSALAAAKQSAFRLLVQGRHVASVIIRVTDRCFSTYEHFRISPGMPITIGRRTDNVISMGKKHENLISNQHATLVMRGGRWCVEDNDSRNGTFLNNRRISGSVPLSYGDCIDLFALRIVFLGNEIAVNILESGARVSNAVLSPTVPSAQPPAKANRKDLEVVFHRSPRLVSRLDTGTVNIDDAPAPKDEVRQVSVLSAIGNGIAMALPMLLGCAMMIYASTSQGVSRGAFMYVGLVTALTSAAMGVYRTLSTMRKAQEEYVAYEALRHTKYNEYLAKCESEIKDRYLYNTQVLRERSLPPRVVCRYTADDAALWSKNVSQPDFLTHRLGLGDMPFQVEVKVPEHRFTLVENDLAATPDQIKEAYSQLKDVPICVDLLEEQLVGIVGGPHRLGAIEVARTLLSQIAATNSYSEVKLVVVYDAMSGGSDDPWSYVRWLPHVWNETRTVRYVASNAEEASDVFYELNKVIRERIEGQQTPGAQRQQQTPLPYYVLLLAAPHLMEGELISKYALNPKKEYGLTTLYLTERYEDLPNECEFVIQNDRIYQGMYHTTDNIDERVAIRFDTVTPHEAADQATALANVRVVETESTGDVPQMVTFFDLYDISKPEQLSVLSNWRKNRTYESMRAVIGQKSGGAPCYLDIHEKYHGPHGLVAGTTGSGKSETLQTFILSLAINFSPDDVSFFIIDYKGGGMANLLSGLPHLVGQISNLSGNQVNRALVSIQSEKNRREAIFKEFGVKDIRDYTKLVKSGEAKVPVPHLIIVIDEFAEMKHDEPEFIQEVVSVSRVGRSLGIHLIMATQRPAGAVSEDIWANSRFKLCLRVQSRQDSTDMLHKPDAAYLTQSGRCYLQVGNDELYELFQSGYSGAVYSGDGTDSSTDMATMISVTGVPSMVGNHARITRQRSRKRVWVQTLVNCIMECGVRHPSELASWTNEELEDLADRVYDRLAAHNIDFPRSDFNTKALIGFFVQVGVRGFSVDSLVAVDDDPSNKTRLPQQPERTQLEAVVAYLAQVAQDNGYTRDYSLFLPLLPTSISVPQLPQTTFAWTTSTIFDGRSWHAAESAPSLSVALGLYDDPLNQHQDVFVYNPLVDGNLAVYGGPQSGKSTFLQTLIYGLTMRYSPAELAIYAVEYSARKLSPFEEAPHVGGVVRDNDDLDKLDKLMSLVGRTVEKRKRIMGEASYQQYLQVHGRGSMPAVLLVIDNYAQLSQRTNDRYSMFLRNLTKEGLAYGVFVAVAAGGVSNSEVPNALSTNFKTVVCLELPNEYDYGMYLRRNRLRLRPESGVAGRGIAVVGDRPLEFQTALATAGSNELEVAEGIRRVASSMASAWRGKAADPIPQIPERPVWGDLASLEGTREMIASRRLLPLGYDVALAEPYGIDLTSTYTYCITGAKKRGKTNTLRVLMMSAKAEGSRVVAVDFTGGMRAFAEGIGAEFIGDEQEFSVFMEGMIPKVVERNAVKAELLRQGVDETGFYPHMQRFERICIFIENYPRFIERSLSPTKPLQKTYDEFMCTMLDKCAQHNIYWFATIDGDDLAGMAGKNLFKLFVRDHKGVHFGGRVRTTALNGFNFENHNRRTADDVRVPGRGMLPSDNDTEVLEVVVPLAQRTSA